MQASKPPGYLSGNVRLSTHVRGKPRKRPMWVARFRVPDGRDSTRVIGPAWQKRGRPHAGFFTRATAEAWLRQFLVEAEAEASAVTVPFEVVAEEYLAECERRIARGDLRATTYRRYRNIIAGPPLTPDGRRRKRSRLTPDVVPLTQRWGNRPLGRISEAEIAAYRQELVERGLSASSINQYRSAIRGLFAFGVERFELEKNPGHAFAWARSRRHKSNAITFYRPDEIRALVRAAASEQDAATFVVAAFTGLRMSELRALRWRALDFADELVHVDRGFTDEGGEDLPKSYRVRSVPMIAQVATVLIKLREREHFTEDDDLVFVNTIGNPVDDDALYRRFIQAGQRAKLRRLRFHDLRHSFGTMAVREFPITDVQEWMGHADIGTTRKYVHYAPRPDAAKRLGALAEAA